MCVQMRETGKRYTDQFKKMIVEIYNTGKPVKEICEEYDINYVSVNNWVNKAQGGSKKISFIYTDKDKYPVKIQCRILGILRNTYYESFHKKFLKEN